jgi:hypothetical protein
MQRLSWNIRQFPINRCRGARAINSTGGPLAAPSVCGALAVYPHWASPVVTRLASALESTRAHHLLYNWGRRQRCTFKRPKSSRGKGASGRALTAFRRKEHCQHSGTPHLFPDFGVRTAVRSSAYVDVQMSGERFWPCDKAVQLRDKSRVCVPLAWRARCAIGRNSRGRYPGFSAAASTNHAPSSSPCRFHFAQQKQQLSSHLKSPSLSLERSASKQQLDNL